MPLALLLAAGDVGLVAGPFHLAQRVEFAVDARLQLGALAQQQVAEEGLLGFVHVGAGGLRQQLPFTEDRLGLQGHGGLRKDGIELL